MIQNFIDNSEGSELTFTYTDEHLKSHFSILVLIKFISAFVKQVKNPKNVHVRYVGERYVDKSQHCFNPQEDGWSFSLNFKFSKDRDKYLQEYFALNRVIVDMDIQPRGALPHWRCMEISNGASTLTLYPDGGIINGWEADEYPQITNAHSNIKMRLKERIKYDIELK